MIWSLSHGATCCSCFTHKILCISASLGAAGVTERTLQQIRSFTYRESFIVFLVGPSVKAGLTATPADAQGQGGRGLEQLVLVEGVPAHGGEVGTG